MKRFTESSKWQDKWFFYLSPVFKLAWCYLCDNCSNAGVIELIPERANLEIGADVDWDDFISRCGDKRVQRLGTGKLWLPGFVDFQYPRGLSEKSNYTKPVVEELKANGLYGAYLESTTSQKQAISTLAPRVLDKDKDKDKEEKATAVPPTKEKSTIDCEPPEGTTAERPTFDKLVDVYPDRHGEKSGLRAAEPLFNALADADALAVMQAARRYRQAKLGGYPVNLDRFLRDEIWRDYYQAEMADRQRRKMAASERRRRSDSIERDRQVHQRDLPEMLAKSWRELSEELAAA